MTRHKQLFLITFNKNWQKGLRFWADLSAEEKRSARMASRSLRGVMIIKSSQHQGWMEIVVNGKLGKRMTLDISGCHRVSELQIYQIKKNTSKYPVKIERISSNPNFIGLLLREGAKNLNIIQLFQSVAFKSSSIHSNSETIRRTQ